ncbi:hypothetical protein [Tunturiibacter lichenicola]|uniref:hypothetical protein n=1 Tax=Tunturiibacter lichenicola TaxID=2051959 RepID=UPI003D9B640A
MEDLKPDRGYFVGIVGVVGAFLVPVLQANGVDVNWQTSIGLYTLFIALTVWALLRYAIPNFKKIPKLVITVTIALVMFWLATYATKKQFSREHPPTVVISWNEPPAIDFGTPLSAKQLDAVAMAEGKEVEGNFIYNPTFGSTLPVGADTLAVTFTPKDVSLGAQTKTVTIRINPLPPKQGPASTPDTASPSRPPKGSKPVEPPSVSMRFFSQAGEPRFVIMNSGDESALRPKWTFGLSDYTNEYYPHYKSDPDSSEPLPIPTKEQDDYVKPHSALGNFEVLNDLTLAQVRDKDQLFGVAVITCMNCPGESKVWFYWQVGSGGWYAPLSPIRGVAKFFKQPNLSPTQIDELITKLVPVQSRIPINEGTPPPLGIMRP